MGSVVGGAKIRVTQIVDSTDASHHVVIRENHLNYEIRVPVSQLLLVTKDDNGIATPGRWYVKPWWHENIFQRTRKAGVKLHPQVVNEKSFNFDDACCAQGVVGVDRLESREAKTTVTIKDEGGFQFSLRAKHGFSPHPQVLSMQEVTEVTLSFTGSAEREFLRELATHILTTLGKGV